MVERRELETLIISSLLQDSEEYQDILLSLDESDFQDHDYRTIFHNLRDGLGLTDCRRGTSLSPGEFLKLVSGNQIPHAAYGHARQLKDIVLQDNLTVELAQLTAGKFDKDEAADRITRLFERAKFETNEDVKTLHELMQAAVHEIIENTDKRKSIIYSPYANLNSMVGGLMPGKLITIAGRPGAGKSAYALSIALSVAKRRFKVLYISLEMLGAELAMRVFSTDTGISTIAMANGKTTGAELLSITDSACKHKPDNLLITNKGRNVSEIRRQITKVRPDLLIIDSVNLMNGKGENERIRITGITREIKQMTLQYNIPALMLAQLSRAAEGRVLPTFSDLKESGSIEEDSDVVLLLSEITEQKDFDKLNDAFKASEGEYLLDPANGFRAAQEAKDKIIIGVIAKNRNGPIGKVAYLCKAKRYTFQELPEAEYLT